MDVNEIQMISSIKFLSLILLFFFFGCREGKNRNNTFWKYNGGYHIGDFICLSNDHIEHSFIGDTICFRNEIALIKTFRFNELIIISENGDQGRYWYKGKCEKGYP